MTINQDYDKINLSRPPEMGVFYWWIQGETPGSAQEITGEYRSVYEMCAFVSFGRTELKMCGEMWGDVEVRWQSIPNQAAKTTQKPTAVSVFYSTSQNVQVFFASVREPRSA